MQLAYVRDEVVKLDVDSYDPEAGKLRLTGNRNKQRTAYITNGAASALNDWLTIRGTQPGALFVEVDKSGKVLTEQKSMMVKPFQKNSRRGSAKQKSRSNDLQRRCDVLSSNL